MMVVARVAAPGASGTALELAGIVERGDELVFDVRGVGAVVAPEPPCGGVERATLHELRQTGGPPVGDHAPPGGRVFGAGKDYDAVADGADGTLKVPIRGDLVPQHRAGEVLAHARSVPSGEDEPVEGLRFNLTPGDRIAELGRLDESLVEPDRLGIGSEATKEHTRKQTRIA